MEKHLFNSTDEWLAYRHGKFTASEMHRLITPGKRPMTDDELAARPKGSKSVTIEDDEVLSPGAITYILEKIAEVIAQPKPEFSNFSIEWGKENEPQAVLAWAEWMGLSVNDPDFMYFGVAEPVAFSMANIASGTPDVLTADALAEIKCPDSHTHAKYLLIRNQDEFRTECWDYYVQIQTNMLFTEREVGYFVSYDPRYKDEALHLKVLRIERDIDLQMLVAKKIAVAKTRMDKILFDLYALNKKPSDV